MQLSNAQKQNQSILLELYLQLRIYNLEDLQSERVVSYFLLLFIISCQFLYLIFYLWWTDDADDTTNERVSKLFFCRFNSFILFF